MGGKRGKPRGSGAEKRKKKMGGGEEVLSERGEEGGLEVRVTYQGGKRSGEKWKKLSKRSSVTGRLETTSPRNRT